jgi:hypothetical protein
VTSATWLLDRELQLDLRRLVRRREHLGQTLQPALGMLEQRVGDGQVLPFHLQLHGAPFVCRLKDPS